MIDQPGYITDNILLLGRRESCVYLLKGTHACALLGGGTVHIIPEVLAQLQEFGIDEQRIKFMVILHSHFDHCGIVPFFKQRWPWANVVASPRAQSILQDPKAIASIEFMNQLILRNYQREHLAEEFDLTFGGLAVDQIVQEGDTLHCDEVSVQVLDVPGHSSCSIALYAPEQKALFASDAAGIPVGDSVFSAANSNFDQYQASLHKMAGYDVEILLAEHYGALSGSAARTFLTRSIQAAAETRALLEASYQRTRDVKQSTAEITDILMQRVPADFLPRPVIEVVVGQMLKFIARNAG